MKTRRFLFILALIILLLTAGLVLYDRFVKPTLPGSWAAILGVIGAALLLIAGFLDNLSGALDFITRLFGGEQAAPASPSRQVEVEDRGTYQEFNAPVTINYPTPPETTPAPEDDSFDASLQRYLQWVQTHYGRLNLRGVEERQRKIHDLTLENVYVSLAAALDPDETQRRRQLEQEKPDTAVDMRDLLSKNDKLAITGASGCGKTTYLRIIASALARAHLTQDRQSIQRYLGLSGSLPIPIFVTLSEYNRYRRQRRDAVDPEDGTLRRFITHRLRRTIGRLPADFFERLLSGGHPCMLLLDGLDEVADETERRLVSAEVQNLVDSGDAAQIIITSRTRAYRGQARLADFRVAHVLPMNAEQVSQLVKQWCGAVYEDEPARNREQQALQGAIDGLEAKRRARNEPPLIETPLMVTVVAIVHYNEHHLPEQRAALYKKCVEVLLAEKHHSATDSTEALRQWGGTETAKFQFLAFLAYKMMCAGEQAGRSVAELQMRRWLLPEFELEYGSEAKARLKEFIEAMRSRESLVSEENAFYRFVHLTFQEYLAAYFLAETVREQQGILDFWAADERLADSWWRETVLLTIGHIGGSSKKSALQLVQKLGGLTGSDELQLAAAELAGTALLELESQDEGTQRQLSGQLARLLAQRGLRLQPATRALAGDALGRLGDERDGVCSLEPELLPITDELTFLMGEKKQKVTIPQPFAIARYPVTNAQFRYFYEDGGYSGKWQRCWTPEGWKYRESGKWTEPRYWRDPQFNLPNQPVVAISWYEAVAYANWLAEKTGKLYRLPTEAEWERAARHTDGRTYPWGDTWQDGYANSEKAGIGRPTAVGIFPDGVAECGVLDLSGNVWEWCQTRWRDEKGEDYLPIWQDDGRENLAGGRSVGRVLKGGAYYSADVPAAARLGYLPHFGDDGYGVRVVVSPFISGL